MHPSCVCNQFLILLNEKFEILVVSKMNYDGGSCHTRMTITYKILMVTLYLLISNAHRVTILIATIMYYFIPNKTGVKTLTVTMCHLLFIRQTAPLCFYFDTSRKLLI